MSRLLKSGDPGAQARVTPLAARHSQVPEQVIREAAPRPAPAWPRAKAGTLRPGTVERAQEGPPKPPKARAPEARFEEERRVFESTIAELRQKLLKTQDNADAREEAAYERGVQEGLQAATSNDAKRNEMLREALKKVCETVYEQLSDCEQLALQLARVALARVFGQAENRAGQVADALGHRLGQLKRELVVAVAVSPEDFSAPCEQLAALSVDYPAVSIECDSNLASGECVARLALGTLVVGIPGQWHRLCEFFDSLATEEPAA